MYKFIIIFILLHPINSIKMIRKMILKKPILFLKNIAHNRVDLDFDEEYDEHYDDQYNNEFEYC